VTIGITKFDISLFTHTGLFKMIVGVWPPRSSDATPCDFFLWGYVKDQVYVPPLPAIIPELEVRIRTAIDPITADMLQTVWNELDYRVDVCTGWVISPLPPFVNRKA
jgi:hypothetical protein